MMMMMVVVVVVVVTPGWMWETGEADELPS